MQQRWKIIYAYNTKDIALVWLFLMLFIAKMTAACLPLHFIFLTFGAIIWFYVASCVCEGIPFFKRRPLELLYAPEVPEEDGYYAIAIDKYGYILCHDTKENRDMVSWWLVHHSVDKLTTKEIWENVII